MEIIKNIIGLFKKEENNTDKNLINYNQNEIKDEPIKNEAKKEFNIINPKELKEANYYKERWNELEEIKDVKELFEGLLENIIKIINHNLIDFSRKFKFIF